ncbi:hypothetical protein ACFLU5_16150 [Bacteroidota bacterium]
MHTLPIPKNNHVSAVKKGKVHFILFSAAILLIHVNLWGQALKPYAKNPFYWEYKGEPVMLLGGSDEDNIFQWTGTKLTGQLNLMKSVGANYIRNTMSDRNEGGEWGPDSEGTTLIYAFKKIGDKYDLNEWNDEYWDRWDTFLKETYDHQIFVQNEIWDGFDYTDLGQPDGISEPLPPTWSVHPWNPKNNVNYTSQETGIPEVWTIMPSHQLNPFLRTVQLNVTVVLQFQEKYIRKMIKVASKYDHVLWTIQNEYNGDNEWADFWADFLLQEAKDVGYNIHVTDMKDPADLSDPSHQYVIDHPELYAYLDVSQNSHWGGQAYWDNFKEFRCKILHAPRPINNTKMYVQAWHEWDDYNTPELAAEFIDIYAPAKLWQNTLGGAASARFHRPPIIYGLGLTSGAQIHIKGLRMLLDVIDVFSCVPHNDLLSERNSNEAYCMANPGVEYAVYFPDGGSVKLDLVAASDTLRMKWLDIENNQWGSEVEIEGGSMVSLQTPGGGHWALAIF